MPDSTGGGPGPTPYDLARRLDDLARRVDAREEATAERFDRMLDRIDQLVTRAQESYVSREAHAALTERVRKIEDRSEWLVRIVGAIVIAAVLGLVIVTNGGGSG